MMPPSGEPLELPFPSHLRNLVTRFALLYWIAFSILVVVIDTDALEWLTGSVSHAIAAFAAWIGRSALGITYEMPIDVTGSGDRTVDWILFALISLTALVGAIAWSIRSRRRAPDPRLREAVRILVRYTLVIAMLSYGFYKVLIVQFPAPGPSRLMQSFGDASPMGLVWTFMGASPVYVFLSGAFETLGAFLLMFRRTTTLGAMVLAVVLTNVVLLNFCYDVPVKLYSVHLLAMCGYLLVPEAGRLLDVLVRNRATAPRPQHLTLPRRWMRVARRIAKYGGLVILIVTTFRTVLHARAEAAADDEAATWYGGFWMVVSFQRDGHELPASTREAARWKRARFQQHGRDLWFRWRTMNGGYGALYDVKLDEQARTITLTFHAEDAQAAPPEPGLATVVLTYTRLDDGLLRLEGKVGAEHLSVVLEHVDTSRMLLVTRGFHWINEVPFNR